MAVSAHALPDLADPRETQAGERIVITAGVPLGTTGATNMLRVAFVTDED